MTQHIDTTGDDQTVARWIWHNLVPESGQASTVQGELLRAVEKLRWEAQENGNINWDEGFVILLEFLEETLCTQAAFSQSERTALVADLRRLRDFLPVDDLEDASDDESLPYVEDDLYDRLVGCVVAFVREHPVPLERELNPKLHR